MSRKHTSALRWFHRLRVGGPAALPPDESADWASWSGDASNLDEFNRVKRLWSHLGVPSAIARPNAEDVAADKYNPDESVSDWLARGNAKKTSD
jgi:hypothetical protein